jgi:hypothetical protein
VNSFPRIGKREPRFSSVITEGGQLFQGVASTLERRLKAGETLPLYAVSIEHARPKADRNGLLLVQFLSGNSLVVFR